MTLYINYVFNFASEYVKEATDGQQSCRPCLCAAEDRDAAEVSAFSLTAHSQTSKANEH